MISKKITDINFMLKITLFFIAMLFFLCSIWGFFENSKYLNTLVEQGQLEAISFNYEIVQFYVSSSGQYFVYSILIFVSAILIGRKNNKIDNQAIRKSNTNIHLSQQESNEKDEEIDEWLTKMMKKRKDN
ncbi:hypothetical protein PVA17_19685 [Lysinibacillus sp. CNPSo 3705]|uniref:hypothetical protein n=1 Tax=Lysinibacillus sp. CNPSo 3705 TaxID=3028148 RepID=UPI0023644AAC|nr:hypothetical protein [Lysinibacillus sp. CNPSo 3705]MDD1504966.1 hypothetical protein [Lysinibacillus sp. CNPSo 3705]